MKLVGLILILLVILSSTARSTDLLPCSSQLNRPAKNGAQIRVLDGDAEISAWHMSPLHSEWRLTIRSLGDKFEMVLSRLEGPSPHSLRFGFDSSDTATYRRLISDELAGRLSEVWAIALAAAVRSEVLWVFDGPNYEFSTGNGACARAVSSAPDSISGRLMALIEEFRGIPMIDDDAFAVKREAEMLAAAEKFVRDYQ